jgi:hypothetical protein
MEQQGRDPRLSAAKNGADALRMLEADPASRTRLSTGAEEPSHSWWESVRNGFSGGFDAIFTIYNRKRAFVSVKMIGFTHFNRQPAQMRA